MSRNIPSDQNIESHLNNAVVQLRRSEGSREEADVLWKVPVERAQSDAWYLEGTSSYTGSHSGTYSGSKQKNSRAGARRAAMTIAAAVLVLVGISYYQLLIRIDSRIYLDVNPSLTLSVNRAGRIVRAEAFNTDGQAVLDQTSLKGEETDTALEMFFTEMKSQGYLSGDVNIVLLSVECESSSRLKQMSEDVSEEIEEYLVEETKGGFIFCQTVHVDEEVRKFARSHSISPGKAALVMELSEKYPELDQEQMASFSMSELVDYLYSQNIDLRNTLDYRGGDLDEHLQQREQKRKGEAGTDETPGQAKESGKEPAADADDLDDTDDDRYEEDLDEDPDDDLYDESDDDDHHDEDDDSDDDHHDDSDSDDHDEHD